MTESGRSVATGAQLLAVSLGGEGILRTTGRAKEAVPVILEALRLGVRYCDTAPAYQQSQDYYGEAFRSAGPGARDQRVPRLEDPRAHARSGRCACSTIRCAGSAPTGSTCGRCTIFARPRAGRPLRPQRRHRGGAAGAGRRPRPFHRPHRAPRSGHPPGGDAPVSLRQRAGAVNPADPRHRPFAPTVLAEARRQGIGVVGMKVMAAGPLLRRGGRGRAHPLRRIDRGHGHHRLLDDRRGPGEPGGRARVRPDVRERAARARAADRAARRRLRHVQAVAARGR